MSTIDMQHLIDKISTCGMITFRGMFTQGIIEEIGTAVLSYLQIEKQADETVMHNVFSVYIEQAQNIRNYFQYKTAENGEHETIRQALNSMVVVGHNNGRYIVCSGNIVDNHDITVLKERIDFINSLSRPQLQQFYQQQLRTPDYPFTGAGLGFVDMARKAISPLEYLFGTRGEQHSFFILKVSL